MEGPNKIAKVIMKCLTRLGFNCTTGQRKLLKKEILLAAFSGFLFLGKAAIAAPPANDNFADAAIITSRMLANPITGSNFEATKEPGEPGDVAWNPNPRSPLGGK